MTGFGNPLDSTGEFSTSALVSGRLYAADYAVPTPAMMGAAIADMGTAYADAAARVAPDTIELGAGNVNDMSLTGGLHKWSSSVSFTDSLTFDAGTNPSTVWILQIAGSLNLGVGARVTLKNGAKASNIFWQIAGAVAIPAGAHAEGVILCKTAIIFGAGSSLNGRALAQTAVTMIATTIVEPPPPTECFFVYSVDPSMIYPFVNSMSGLVGNTRGLVGNTWQGLQLSITQGDTTITQAGGKPLTVTSPNALEGDGFNVVSEDFCLGDGIWKVRMGAFAWNPSTHPETGAYDPDAASYLTLEERSAPEAPINTVPVQPQAIVDWAKGALGVDVNNFDNSADCTSDPSVQGNCFIISPFEIRWAIFPAEMRADAEAAADKGAFGMSFIQDNQLKGWAIGEVDYETEKVVPFVSRA
eukprot:scaffold40105_cov54-Phaeocystis_antarctica.AAC.2